ncbi:MAG: Outer rane receptor for ferrienterochelin and colicin [Candidatus Solibacter sp.]|nr:Outer rane receptor for ferrienterochelin and colicin [Candidatus Solibacter sp.]
MTRPGRLVSLRCIPLLTAAALLAGSLPAQESRGSITGQATDSSGAAVPRVKISAVNTATKVTASATTNSTGTYTIFYLIPGTYDLTAELSGFATIERRGVEVQVGDKLDINFQLQVAGTATSVEVAAETPLLTTETASSGTVIDRRQITELPLPYGNPFMLTTLAPGVVFTGANMLQIRPYDNSVTANIRVDGAPGGSEFSIDGSPNTATTRGTQKGAVVAYVPPAEAVQEFKMETSNFDARQGHAPGAAVNVTVKSGTNQLHGSGWEFTSPGTIVANDFFLKRAGQTPTSLSDNRFGGAIGGPAFLPKLYDGRNRTFFFFAYENMMSDQPNGSVQTVPTAANRQGDFSSLLAQNILIYDPTSALPATGGRIQRTPFAGNLIPSNRLSPIAQAVLKYYPLPNAAGDAQGSNNFISNNEAIDRFNSQIARIDHTFNEKNHSFARLQRNFRNSPSTGWEGGNINGINPTQGLGYRGNQGLALDHVVLISPSDLLDISAGITRYYVGSGRMAEGFDPASLGFPTSTVALFSGFKYFPSFAPSGYGTVGASGGDFQADNTFFIKTAYTKTKGKHSLNVGYDIRAYRENTLPTNSPLGSYSFANTYTKGPLDNSSGAPVGQSLASFLLGLPTGGSIDRVATSANQALFQAVYLHDDFKISRRLTLNIGLRYENESPTTDRYNRNVRSFDFTSANPIEAAARAAYTAKPDAALAPADFHVRGGVLFADSSHRGFWDKHAALLQPRVGLAYSIDSKTVVRGGWGMYMIPFGVDGVFQPGYSQTTSIVPTLNSGLGFVASLANPFPNGVTEPNGAAGGLATFLGQSVSLTPLDRQTGKVQRWQLGIQRQLPGRFVVEVAYAGTRGYDMTIATNLNSVPRQYLSASAVRDTAVVNFLTASVTNPMAGLLGTTSLSGTTVARSQLLLPFPQFSAVNSERYDGSTHYNGLELRANRRFRSGFTLNMSYGRSRLMERLSLLNPTDVSPENRVSGEDRPNRFQINGIWEVPFGKGRKFGSSWNRLVDGVFGGWQLTGVYVIQSGRPIGVGNLYFTGDPNKVVAHYDKNRIDQPVFDLGGFYFHDAAVQTNGVDDAAKQRADQRIALSNNIRTLATMFPNFRGDRVRGIDCSLIKTVHLTERFRAQVRAEAINALNQVQFNNPGVSPTNAAFGLISASSQLNPPRTIQLGFKLAF